MEIDEFVSACFDMFKEHVQHSIDCPSVEAALSFLQSLSFVSVAENALSLPQHMKSHVFRQPKGNATVILAGKFSVEENYEIRRLAKDRGLSVKSNAAGESEGVKLTAALKRLSGSTKPATQGTGCVLMLGFMTLACLSVAILCFVVVFP